MTELYPNPHKLNFLVKNIQCKGKSVLRSVTKKFLYMFEDTNLPPHQENEANKTAARDHLHVVIPCDRV